ncbi:MAG: hypothetical protein HZB56_15840 [Deltaproteobacteria bacterium]|nr:hypothetical protein [Deltaproteobacteria bacterium]
MNDARKWGALLPALAALAACGGSTAPAGQQQNTGPQLPRIDSFAASPALVAAGGSSTLSWSVTGADGLELDQGIGAVTGTSHQVSPSATTTYRLTARNAAGSASAAATVTLASGSADVTVAVDSSAGRRPISPLVYGFNGGSAAGSPPGTTWLRLGGNRWTAYNWESNYSNAGSDWGPYSNDTYMGTPADGPAAADVPALDDGKANGLGVCVTIPIQGWVSKDPSGNVSTTGPLTDHFLETRPRKGSAFASPPDATDSFVYQDELAAFLAARWAGASHPLHLMLDNEPDLWSATHAEIQRSPLGYASLLSTTTASAKALKDAVPSAMLFGPVSYGWYGFLTLQDAPDAGALGDFLDHYLSQMKSASDADGRRLLDVLDLHFYSEAQGCGVRVTGSQTDDCTVAARVQAPRSLADPGYTETSWITQYSTGGPIALVPRMQAKIDARFPGTLFSLSEYSHGGEGHVSGAVAQADTLGILGEQGVYAASLWPLSGDLSWISAAWLAYRNYDGAGSHFGDTAVSATSSDPDHLSVHASADAGGNGRLVLVLVHRPTLAGTALDGRSRTVALQVSHPVTLGKARLWQLTAGSPVQGGVARPQRLADAAVSGGVLTLTLPAMSVTTVELTP